MKEKMQSIRDLANKIVGLYICENKRSIKDKLFDIISSIIDDTEQSQNSHPPIQYYKDKNNINIYNITVIGNNNSINIPNSPKKPNKIIEIIKFIISIIKCFLGLETDNSSHHYKIAYN